MTGQKIWSTRAHVADCCELLVRTDPDAPKHKGITWLILDMHQPGVEVRPMRTIDGESHFCEVFLDEVRVPVANRVGDENDGWRVTNVTLRFERGTAFAQHIITMRSQLRQLVALAQARRDGDGTAWDDPTACAQQVGRLEAAVEALWRMTQMCIAEAEATGLPSPIGLGGEARATASSARRSPSSACGCSAGRSSGGPSVDDIDGAEAVRDYLWSLQYTIAAGTSQIQRNLIAERILGHAEGPLTVRWTFGERAARRRRRSWPPLLRRVTGPGARARGADDPAVDRAASPTCATAERRSPRRCRPTPAPRVGRRAPTGDGRVYLDHARDIGAFNPCFPEYEIDGRRRPAPRDRSTFPIVVRGPAGPRPRRRSSPCSSTASIQHHNCDVGVAGKTTVARSSRYRRPTPLLTPLDVRDRPHGRRATASSRPPGCCAASEVLCRGDDARPSPATGRTCPTCRPGGPTPMTSPTWSTPATTCRSPSPALLRARAAERGDRPARCLRRRRRSPTPRPTPARPRWPGACWRPAPGKGTHVGAAAPERRPTSSWPGSPPPASARSRSRSARSRRPPSWRGLLRGADVEVLLAPPSYRSHATTSPTLGEAVPELDLVGAAAAARPDGPDAAPRSRSPAPIPASTPAGPSRRCSTRRRRSTTTCSRAAEAEVTPADRMVIVHTSGSTSAPKGVIHTHGPLIRHLDNLNQLRRYDARRGPVLQLAVLLDRRLRLRLLGTLVAGATPRRARTPPTPAGVLDLLERERPTMVNGFAAVGRPPARRPVVRRPRPVVDPARQPLADHAGRRRGRPIPSCATRCSA